MSYFNHSFFKRFLATGVTRNLANTGAAPGPTNPYSTGGFIITPGVPSVELSRIALGGIYTPGYVMFADKAGLSLDAAGLAASCCEVYIISTSLLTKDKIGSHGGFRETNKSKKVNPKYVDKVYKVEDCLPQQAIVSIGTTPETAVPGLPAENFQGGTIQTDCQKDFFCGEAYDLRIDLKGSPVLRFLNRNSYVTVTANGGCCPGPAPSELDPTTIYIQWADLIVANAFLTPFIVPVVFDTTGTTWYAPGTTVDPISGAPVLPAQWWSAYVPVPGAPGLTAGMRLIGAYVDTVFGTCSFRITDFFQKEPVQIFASLVDETGDPCVFSGLCIYNDCLGLQGNGFGDTVLKDIILSESYLQNYVDNTDVRVREITQGDDILNSVNRNAMYTRYYIQHVVPRFNNPSSTFDNDRYLVEIITPSGGNAALEAAIDGWLGACQDCVTMEVHSCTACTVTPNP